ncbi:MAG: hypothetical protein OXE99_08925 [Cellvibrionales bacterium]|nr:hypothetical protein [Cellvibrionales bacterium]
MNIKEKMVVCCLLIALIASLLLYIFVKGVSVFKDTFLAGEVITKERFIDELTDKIPHEFCAEIKHQPGFMQCINLTDDECTTASRAIIQRCTSRLSQDMPNRFNFNQTEFWAQEMIKCIEVDMIDFFTQISHINNNPECH